MASVMYSTAADGLATHLLNSSPYATAGLLDCRYCGHRPRWKKRGAAYELWCCGRKSGGMEDKGETAAAWNADNEMRADDVPRPAHAAKFDAIRVPAHYASRRIEVIEVIEVFELNYRLGNVVKYVLRAGNKCKTPDDPAAVRAAKVEDLRKARQYITREINALLGNDKGWNHADE